MQQAVTPAPQAIRRRVPALAGAVLAVVATLAGPGCGGRGSDTPRTPPRQADLEPVTRPTTQDSGDQPSTRPTTRPVEVEQPATRPATRPEEPIVEEPPATRPATSPSTAPATAPTTAPETQAQPPEPRLLLVESPTPHGAALGEIFAGYAEMIGRGGAEEGSAARQAALLLEAAVRLAPRDARLARRLVSAQMAAGDVPASVEALDHYRNLRPNDVLAQIRFVDLSAAQMESVDQRLEYLERVAQSDRVPEEVRSHAAVMASVLLREMLDEARADLLLGEAVALDPYSPQALQMFYERLVATGEPRARRVDALAMLARSNILQPAVLSALAQEVAAAGLLEPANELYRRATQVHGALALPAPPSLLRDMAALHLITNRPQSARQILSSIESAALASPPATAPAQGGPTAPAQGEPLILGIPQIDALMLQPMTAEGAEARATAARRGANLIRVYALNAINRALTDLPPSPPPADLANVPEAPLPDVLTDARKLAARDLPPERLHWRDIYAVALANAAWMDLYYVGQPTDERLIAALAILAPEDSASLARLQGWQLWRLGQTDAARQRLEAAADRDALARLGLLMMDGPPEGGAGWPEAQEVLDSHPAGLSGAFLADALRPHGVAVLPAEDAPDVQAALATLPMALFEILEPENVRQFYSLTADPQKVRHEYGEPLLLDVSLRNSGRYPITIGPEGLLRPIIRLDALLTGQGIEPIPIPAANAVELWEAVRLDPGDKIEQTVRLDGGAMRALMAQEPQLSLTINGELTTNPAMAVSDQGTAHVTGPAGLPQRLRRVMTRSGFVLDLASPQVASDFGERLEDLRTGEPLVRLRMAQWALGQIEAITRQVEQRRQAGAPADELDRMRSLSSQMYATLSRAAGSLGVSGPDAAANAWVKYAAAAGGPAGEGRIRVIRELLGSSAFEARLLGLIAAANLVEEDEAFAAVVGPLAEDGDPTVRSLARELLAPGGRRAAADSTEATTVPMLPTTGPTTVPAPTTGPATPSP